MQLIIKNMKNETLVLDVNEDDTILNTKAKFED